MLEVYTGDARDATSYNLQYDKTHHGFQRLKFFMRAYLNEGKALTDSFCQRCTGKFDFSHMTSLFCMLHSYIVWTTVVCGLVVLARLHIAA